LQETIVEEHRFGATCRRQLLRNIGSAQLAGDNCWGTSVRCNLQETIVEEHRFGAICRKQLLRNIGSPQFAGDNCWRTSVRRNLQEKNVRWQSPAAVV